MNSAQNTLQTNNRPWAWNSVDPLTKTVVAAFSGRIGDEAAGDLSTDDFVSAMTEAFPKTTKEDITKTVGWLGTKGIQNAVVNQLTGLTHDSVSTMTDTLGSLAGEQHAEVASLTGQVLELPDSRIYEAIPALKELSELAIRNLAAPGPQN